MEDDGQQGYGDTERGEYNRDRRGDKRDRGGGRRRERKPRERMRKERERHDSQEGYPESENAGNSMKTPIILAKKSQSQVYLAETQKKETPTIIGIQRRSGNDSSSHNTQSSGNSASNSSKSCSNETYSSYQRHSKYDKQTEAASPSTPLQPQSTSHVDQYVLTGLAALKISPDAYPLESISVIDGGFQWSDKAFETLLDQTDYVVVGCVGMQGAGKSTLMSLIAGQNVEQIEKTRLVFRPQKKADIEKCIHRTVGVDIYVTNERMILLDTQPLMSPSMLGQYLNHERKVPSEYSTAEICLEVQALQLLTFLYTVCHVVLVVQDHMVDLNLMNLLKTSEMLKPSTISHGSQENSNNADDMSNNEFFPHLVFIYTCCDELAFETDVIRSMCEVTWSLFEHSRLHVKGSASMLREPIIPVNRSPLLRDHQDMNIFFLPCIANSLNEEEEYHPLSKYRGYPSLDTLLRVLRQQLAAMPRVPFTHHLLSERNWFHYAARTWEAVKKSNLIGEYHRLLSA